jgi:hypothetical protein
VPEARQRLPQNGAKRPGPVETRPVAPGDVPLRELAARIGRNEWEAGASVATVGGF